MLDLPAQPLTNNDIRMHTKGVFAQTIRSLPTGWIFWLSAQAPALRCRDSDALWIT
jgi:hypothetical protein